MRLTFLSILILSTIITVLSRQVVRRRPIFGNCIDKELSSILKIITVARDQNGPSNPTSEIERNRIVDSLMRMIKQYLAEERSISQSTNRRSRKFFFWPFRPWGYRQVEAMQGGLQGGIYGGFGPQGFHFGGGLDGGLMGHWQN